MDTEQKEASQENILTTWLKSTTDFWTSMTKMWPQVTKTPSGFNIFGDSLSGRSFESWQSSLKLSEALFSALGSPGTFDTTFRGVSTLPEIIFRFAKTGWDGFFHLQEQWLKKSLNITEPTEAYKFKRLDQNTIKAWLEIYEKDLKQFLNIPKLGLTRTYQEKMSHFLDKLNLFQSTLAEFLYIIYLPIEKSILVMQQKMEEFTREGELSGDFKEYYKMWIKILEGHYMTLYKSPEYTKALGKLLTTAEDFKMAREEVLMDVFQNLPFPTHRDIDELYKEIYHLKRKVRELSKERSNRGKL